MTLKPLCLIRAALLTTAFLSVGPIAHAQIALTLTNSVFFTNTILLDGDISDFFLPNSTNARPGVGVALDSAGEVPAVPGSRGLGESPLDRTTVKSGVLHPSGFNQRRILSAYNPGLNGGTIFIGIDLPGGTGSPANPNFRDALGPTRLGADGLMAIRPFDADGNGDPQTIGQSGSTRLFRCGDPLATPTTVDVINCTNPAAGGFTDAVDRDQDIGNLERYGVTIVFADGTQAQVELFENNFTPFGKAALLLTSNPPRRPFGALASVDASNTVLGVDVEFAITNVNNSVEPCGLLLQVIRVNSGSLQDGSSNGEDFNTMSNRFALVASLDLSQGPVPLGLVPGQPLGLSGTVRNSGQIDLTNVCVTNLVVGVLTNKVLGPVTLRAGESLSFSNTAILPLTFTNCSLETIWTAIGFDACGGARLTATTSTNVFVAHLLQVVCPTNLPVQCLSSVPSPDPAVVMVTSTAGQVEVRHLGDLRTTNGAGLTVTRTYEARDGCSNRATCMQLFIVRDTQPPVLLGVPTNHTYQCLSEVPAPPRVTAVDNCDGTNLVVTLNKLTNGTCPTLVVCRWSATDRSSNSITVAQTNTVLDTTPPLLVGVPPPRTFQCLSELPPPARVTALDNCDGTNLTVTLSKSTNGNRPTLVICSWMAADRCGNVVSASQTNTVQDITPPTLVGVPTNRIYQCLSEVPAPPRVTAVDNCDGTNLVVTLSKTTNGTCPTLVVCTWSATDRSSNSITVAQTNTVLDTTPPMLVGVPPPRTFQCLSELPPPARVTVVDNCEGTNLTVTFSKSTNGTVPTLVICTWMAADRCGNVVSASQTNTVQDITRPTLVGVTTNRTYQCLGDVPVPPSVTAADNCDGTNVVVTLSKTTNGTCPTLVVCTWNATDRSGNSITVAQTNTVLDTTPPMLVGVPPPRAFQCLNDLPSPAAVTALDNCDGTNLTVLLTKSTNGTRPTVVICTWTATDRCGNRVFASQTNTVQDITPPTLVGVPSNGTYQCVSEVPVPPSVTAVDNCDGTNLVVTLSKRTNGTCPTLVVCTWSAADRSGNSITVAQTNTVLDTTPPLLVGVPPPRVFQCLSELPPPARVTALDNCDGTNLTVLLSKSTNGTRPTVVICTWTAADRCGNRVSASQTNTVQDITPPMLVGVPTNRTYQCLSEVPAPPRVTAVDNCDGTNLVVTLKKLTNGTCPTLVVCTWSATDRSSNSITVGQTNMVLDTTPPLLMGVPPPRAFQCLSELPPPARVTALDNCDGTNLTVTLSKSTNGTRPTLVICTWTAADRCGNRVSASQTNTVQDITPPLLVGVPTNRTYQCLSEVPAPPRVTAVDDCDGTNLVVTLSKMTNGTCPTLVICTWSATDGSGNSITVAQTNTVLDITPPLLVGVPPPRTFQCLSELPPPASVTAIDNCDGTNLTVTLTKSTNGTRPTLVICTWTAADRCGNRVSASQSNTVQDIMPPTLVGVPTNRTYQCLSEVAAPPPVTAMDDCDGTNLVVTLNKLTNGNCPTLVICTWSATDGSGNSITVAQTNTVLDTTPPLLMGVPPSRTFQCLSELPPPASVTATDNCDGTNLTVTLIKSTNGTRPTLVICTWMAVDRCNNRVSASQTNTVQDITPPTLVGVPTNRTYQCLSEVPVPPRVTAMDDCDGTNLVVTLNKLTNGNCPTLVICTWSATDGSGNSITVAQTNTVLDTTPPLLMGVPPSRTFQCLSELPPPASVTATDNCDGTNLTVTLIKSTNGTRPTLVICTWMAVDRCNNRVSASQTNTVQDITPPTLVGVPTNRTYQCLSEVPVPPRVTAMDDCDGTNLVVTLNKLTNGNCPTLVICTWSATDGSGNSITVAQTNTVLDTTPPLLMGVPPSRTFQCLSELPPPASVTATDNCDGTNLTVTLIKSTNGTRPTLVICTWMAVDRCNNRVSASQTNTVQDITPPTLVGVPTNRTYQCLSEVPAPPRVTAVDDCDGTNLVVTLNKMTNGNCPTLVICVWSATDGSGNSIIVGQTNTVLDITPPLLVGVPPPRTFQCVSELPPPVLVTAIDNCEGTNLMVTLTKSTNGTRPTLVICTWTAADRCGNRASASQTNTVQDTTPPVLVGVPANRTFQCLNEVPASPRVTAMDNCDGTNLVVTLNKMTNGNCPTLVVCTWSATDGSGNSITVAQTNTVIGGRPVLISAPTDQAVAAGAPATFCLEASSACPLTYSWLKDGVVIAGAHSPCYTIPAVTAADSGQYCVRVTGDCGALTNCARLTVASGAPCLALAKTADRPLALPNGPVTYTYTVTNCGSTTLTDIVITDDNGTPSFTNDDFIVAVVASLAPGATMSFTRTVPLPMRLCDEATGQESGLLITEVLADGNIKATFIQDFGVNDNTYGVNSIGWGKKLHKFSNLTGSDQATFQFKDGVGQVVLEFKEDYISASTAYPSGFGTLGVTGGDGGIKVGAAADVLFVSTSLTENLNKPPFLNHLAQYTVDSPALSDPNSGLWEYRMTYTVVVDKAAFGASGFGSVTIIAQHNSPGKRNVQSPMICPACVTNIATGTANAGGTTLMTRTTATVCVSEGCSVCDLRYPFASDNARTSVVFNESEILRAFSTGNVGPGDTIKLWYNDEHALVLGVRQVVVKTSSGSTITDYSLTPLPAGCGPNGCSAINPLVGSTLLSGDQAGTDVSDRPMFPALFLTDITSDPSSLVGDWQFGGTPIPPHAVFGTWKGAVRVVDKTKSPAKVEVNPDADPPKNNWNLDGGDPVPAGAVNQGYGAEARWNVDDLGLIQGHTYRAYFMVHDGDQNKTGGDVGHGCVTICFEGNPCPSNDCIKVTTEIGCLLPGDNCTPFGKVATGFKGLQDPAFCYQITVTNCGEVPLTNVTVGDDQLGNLSAHFPQTLAPRQAAVQVFKMAWSANTTNTVTATARSADCGQTPTARDSATALVQPARLDCVQVISTPDDLDNDPNDDVALLPNDGLPHPVTITVVVTNTGDADLANVTLSAPTLADLGCSNMPAPFALAARASARFELCAGPLSCPISVTNLNTNDCANPLLGAAAMCAVLQLGEKKVELKSESKKDAAAEAIVIGHVCIGPKGKLTASGEPVVTGNIELASGAEFKNEDKISAASVIKDADLSAALADAREASQSASALHCTQSFGQLDDIRTILGNGTVNVLCVQNLTLQEGQVLTLHGGLTEVFVINVTGKFSVSDDSRIELSGGLAPRNVLFNVTGKGEVSLSRATLHGTILAPARKVSLAQSVVFGAVLAGDDIKIEKDSSVRCGPAPPTRALVNLVSVTAHIDPSRSGACASDISGNPIQVTAQCAGRVDCAAAPTEARECDRGLVAFRLRYTGPTRAGPLTLKFTAANSAATATYSLAGGLATGDVLSLSAESDPGRPWTLDATKHGASRLGTRTTVYFNGVLTEILHTSCSCRMNNFVPGLPACLDASSPNNLTGTKGEPSPNFLVLDFE